MTQRIGIGLITSMGVFSRRTMTSPKLCKRTSHRWRMFETP